jgi:hypothetical protein
VLSWEGSLIDPVGGILGAVVFHAVVASTRKGPGYQLAQFLAGIGVGLAGGIAGTALLWLLLRKLQLGEVLGTTAQLASVVAVAAGCDMIREDSGLISAIVMGLAVANLRGFDVPARRPFVEVLVQLIIGVLFIAISATASTFSAGLVAQHIQGAAKILPVTFLVIVVTVALYGLTAVPVARRVGVTRPARTRPLLVGGEDWVVDLGRALRSLGLEVLMWAGFDEQRQRIKAVGLEPAPGELLAAATGRGAQLEGITALLLLTSEDDFNALGSIVLQGSLEGPVYRLGARLPSHGVVAPYTGGEILFAPQLTRYEVGRRYSELGRNRGIHGPTAAQCHPPHRGGRGRPQQPARDLAPALALTAITSSG